jgi:hypothetical protein
MAMYRFWLHRCAARSGGRRSRGVVLALTLLGLAAVVACGGRNRPDMPAPGEVGAEKFLFDQGQAALEDRRWIEARFCMPPESSKG